MGNIRKNNIPILKISIVNPLKYIFINRNTKKDTEVYKVMHTSSQLSFRGLLRKASLIYRYYLS